MPCALQRQLEAVLANYRQLESRLEARGLSLRDLGLTPGGARGLCLWGGGACGREGGKEELQGGLRGRMRGDQRPGPCGRVVGV